MRGSSTLALHEALCAWKNAFGLGSDSFRSGNYCDDVRLPGDVLPFDVHVTAASLRYLRQQLAEHAEATS